MDDAPLATLSVTETGEALTSSWRGVELPKLMPVLVAPFDKKAPLQYTRWTRLMPRKKLKKPKPPPKPRPPPKPKPPPKPRKVSKRLLTVRVDLGVLAYFKSTGRGWQTRMNEVLLRHAEAAAGPSALAEGAPAASEPATPV